MSKVEAFELLEVLGEGGMGVVYRVRHAPSGEEVALKILRDRSSTVGLESFEREVQAHAGLTHPGVVSLFDYGAVEPGMVVGGEGLCVGERFVVMELAEWGDVTRWMPMVGWSQVREVLEQTLRTLGYTHARNVIHRDLKPENLLVFSGEDAPRFKIADFGIAYAASRVLSEDTAQLEMLMGTPYYMSPEQTRGQWYDYGPWTDLYAMGCIAYELVSGRPPFDADNAMDLLWMQQSMARPELTPRFEVPDGLAAWIERAMAIDRTQRFQSAAEALHALPEHEGARSPWPFEVGGGPATRRARERVKTPDVVTLILEGGATSEVDTDEVEPAQGWEELALALTQVDVGQGSLDTSWSWRGGSTWRVDVLERELPSGMGLGLFGLREVPMVGRERERDLVWSVFERVFVGHRSEIVWIVGDEGVGKSKLAEWMSRRAHEVGAAQVLRVTHDASAPGRSDGLVGMLVEFFHAWKLSERALRAHLARALPRGPGADRLYEADIAALAELMSSGHTQPERGARHVGEGQMFALLERVTRRLAIAAPLVVTIDDAQWGAEASRWLEFMQRSPLPTPVVFLCVSERDRSSGEGAAASAPLERLGARASGPGERVTRLELEALTAAESGEMLMSMLPLEGGLVDTLIERAEGSPMFAVHLLGHIVDSGGLEISGEGYQLVGEGVEIPDGVARLWEERLERALGGYGVQTRREVYEALELAATLGRRVNEAEWLEACGASGVSASFAWIDALAARGLVRRDEGGWSFEHGLLRASLERRARRDGLSARRHVACARGLEALYGARDVGTARRRAGHLRGAGEHAEAETLLLDACDQLLQRGRLSEYEETTRAYLESTHERGLTPGHPDVMRGEIYMQFIGIQRGRLGDASARLLACHGQAAALGNHELMARAALGLGSIHYRKGETERAGVWDLRAYTSGLAAGLYAIAARALRSAACFGEGHERAIEMIDELGSYVSGYDLIELWQTRVNVLIAFEWREEAERTLAGVIQGAEDGGFLPILLHASNAMGELARYDGRLGEAARHYVRAQQVAREIGLSQVVPLIGLNLVQIGVAQRRFEMASELLRRSSVELDRQGIREARQGLITALELALAAGSGDADTFDDVSASIGPGWGTSRRLVNDHPRIMESAAEFSRERGDRARAHRALALAHEMWTRLEIPEGVVRVEEAMRRG